MIGTLINNVWSVAGSGSRPPVNQMLLQYFVNYNLKKGWYLATSPIITADWRASSGNQWVVPFGGGVGRIMRLGNQPVNLTGSALWQRRVSDRRFSMGHAAANSILVPEEAEVVTDLVHFTRISGSSLTQASGRRVFLLKGESQMRMTGVKKVLSTALCLALVLVTMPPESGALMFYQDQQPPPGSSPAPASDYPGQGAPSSAQELQNLVAPIALYPDALVAQILSAATFPDQVAVADNWMQQNKNLTGTALGQAVNAQSWDPSVKALTQFPSVLHNLAQNLAWTSQLGEAYHNQASDVMAAVQTLRAQAKAAGNLKSTPQQTVTTQSQGETQVIVIQPANPQVVYVPEYNPTVVYGTPYIAPGYSTGDLVATGLLSFGAGMAVGAMMSGGCCGWGYSSWNCNWHGGGVYYGGHPYYGNSAWHGGYYGNGYDT